MSAEATNQQGAKITVYWLNNSRAHRAVWLLEELNLEYDVKVFKRNKNMRAPAELKEVHPLGKSPVVGIKVPDVEKEIILAESATIMEYLCEHFGKSLIPKRYPEGKEGALGAETEEWMRYKFLMDYAEGSLVNGLLVALITINIRKAPIPFFLKPITNGVADKVDAGFTNPELKLNFDFLENYLAEAPNNGDYFCGTSLTAADVMVHFVLEDAVQRVPLTEQAYPKLYSYVRRLQQRDAYKRAGERISKLTGEAFVPMSEVKY